MPPRIRHPKVSSPSFNPSTSTHKCQCPCQNHSRNFSSTPSNATRQRAEMFRWLSGPGKVFKQPLPGSTNYLNAYDQSGNLLRARNRTVVQDQSEVNEEDEDDKTGPGRQELNKAKLNKTVPGLPKETTEDLMPFPMNQRFRSQTVLSEELKDAIWKRVMEDGKSVRDVSATLHVDMNRVGAVVRLKAVEKKWEQEVCHPLSSSRFKRSFHLSFRMMRQPNRLVLKTSTLVTKNNYNSLKPRFSGSISICILFSKSSGY